jgi:integrase
MAMSLHDLYEQHYRPARLMQAAAHTKNRYEMDIKRFEQMLGRRATVTDLNTAALSAMLESMLDAGLSSATVYGVRGKFMALWRFAHAKRLTDEFPMLAEIVVEQDPPTAWTASELERLMQAVAQTKGEMCGIPAALWWSTLHRVILDTATRIGAVLKLEWPDLDLDRGTVLFRAKNQKTKRGQVHPLKPETVAELRLMVEPERKLVWPLPWHSSNLHYHYKPILERAGLPTTHRDMFHKLRRTTATMFAAAGGDPSRLLGHTSIKHLEKYLDETQVERPSPAKLLPAMGRPIASRKALETQLERLLEAFLSSEATRDSRSGMVSPRNRGQLRHAATRYFRLGDLRSVADLTLAAVEAADRRIAEVVAESTLSTYRRLFLRLLRWLVTEGHDVEGALMALGAEQVYVCQLVEEGAQ